MTDDRDPRADARPDDPAEWFTAQFDEDVDDEPADVEGFAAPRSAASALGGDYSSPAGGGSAESGFRWGLTPRTFDDDSPDDSVADRPDAEQDSVADEEVPADDVSVDTVLFSVDDDLAASGPTPRESDADSEDLTGPDVVEHGASGDPDVVGSADSGAPAVAESVDTGAARLAQFPPPPVITRGPANTASAPAGARDSLGVDAPPPVDVSLAGDSERTSDSSEAAGSTAAVEDVPGTAESTGMTADLAEAAAEIPTMEEVLEAPSPRRAAREAAAKEAALREAAERAGRTGVIPTPSFSETAGRPAEAANVDAPAGTPSSAHFEPELASPVGPASPASPVDAVPEPAIGENDFAVAEPVDGGIRSPGADAAAAFIAGRGRPATGDPELPGSGPVEVPRYSDTADPVPTGATATEDAPLFAGSDDESTVAVGASRSSVRPARAPATTRQKVLFAILAIVIVVGLVLLVVMLTSQGGTAGALDGGLPAFAQSSSSVSNGSVATSS